jgi:hypothetical protein
MDAVMKVVRFTGPALDWPHWGSSRCACPGRHRAHTPSRAPLCLPNNLNGELKVRAGTTCKSNEIQVGSSDGTTLQFSGVNVQVVFPGRDDRRAREREGKSHRRLQHGACSLVNVIPCTTTPDCPPNQCLNVPPRTGSHNLVIGDQHSFTSYGGLVAGNHNAITAPSASITAGLWASVAAGA